MKMTRPVTSDIEEPNTKRFIEDLYKLHLKNISYGHTVDGQDQNIDGRMVEVPDTGLADTEFIVTHNLGRVPLFYDIKYQNKATGIYDSGTAWTKTQIFLKSSTANVKLRLFVH